VSDRVQVRLYNRAGVLQTSIDDPLNVRFTDSERDAAEGGEGAFRIPMDHSNAGLVDDEQVARIRVDGSEIAGFETRLRDGEPWQDQEHAGQILEVSGESLGIVLGTSEVGGAVVMPCGGIDAFSSDMRSFGWMDCCCFDHVARFASGGFGLCVRQDATDSRFTADEPSDWPDRAARRVYCSAPSEVEAGLNAVQTITFGTSIDSGQFTLTFEGETTAPITSPWSAANVKAALDAVIPGGTVSVTGAGINSDHYRITFDGGSVANRPVALLGTDHSQLNHPPNGAVNPVMEIEGQTGVYSTAKGCCYAYDTFTTAADRNLTLFVSLSEVGEIWIDGTRVYSQTSGSAGRGMSAIPIDLPAGTHCITASACKVSDDDNMAWMMWSLAEAVQDDEGTWQLGQVVHRSNCNMRSFSAGEDDPPPGAKVGEILVCLLEEAQADGFLEGVTWDITKTHDSGGVAWAEEYVWGVKIGTGYLDVLQQLSELAGLTFRMSPTLVLSVWQDRGTDRTGSVVFTPESLTGGVLVFATQTRAKRASHLLIETQEGFAVANDAGATGPARQIGITMGTSPNYKGLSDFVVHTFKNAARRTATAALQTWGPTGLRPMFDFFVNDIITAPNENAAPTPWEVTSIQMQMDPNGDPLWTVLLKDVP
jgi:hypothetical protein